MARGTGLPIIQNDVQLQPAPRINADAFSSAAAWGQIAQAGAQLREAGLNSIERESHKANVGYLADQELEITRKRIELQDQFAKDPSGFDKAWTAYSDGKLSEAQGWAVPHLKKELGQNGNSAYASLLSQKRTRDEALEASSVKALVQQTGDDVVGAAMSGTLGTDLGKAKIAKYRSVLDAGVEAGLLSPEEAEIHFNDITSRASAETVIKSIGDTYRDNRARGVEAGPAALKQAEELLLRTQDPRMSGLSEEQRYAYYHKATAEIRALEAERKQDLAAARQQKTDLEFGLNNGVRPAQESIDEVVALLNATGGHADAARLRASVARADQIAAFGKLPLAEQVRQYEGATDRALGRTSAAGLDFIRGEEGFTPTSRWDVRQFTNGFGTRGAEGETITQEEANRRLVAETAKIDAYIAKNVTVPLTQAQHDALVSFGFNLGTDDIGKLLPDINAGNFERVAERMKSFNQAGGQVLPGLVKRREREAAMFLGEPVTAASPAVDVRSIAGQRKILSSSAGEKWKDIVKQLDDGVRPDPREVETVTRAATLAGDHNLLEEIGERLDRFDAAQVAGRAPIAAQEGATAELRNQPALSAGQAAWLKDLERTTASTLEKITRDPVALGAERFPERFQMPETLDLTDPNKALAGLNERLRITSFVAENYGRRDIPALSQSDRRQIAGAIAAPTPEPQQGTGAKGGIVDATPPDETRAAFDVLTNLPDDFLGPTLRTDEIKAAIAGAARSNDPVKFNSAMQALDKLWARAPQEIERVFGEDTIKSLQDWQARLRYHTPEELADRLRLRDDPQLQERRKAVEAEGRKLAKDKTIDSLTDDLDPGWFTLGPNVPADGRTRDMALADYQSLFAERYAETGDQALSHKQAIERMRLYWGRSEINGGRLTLRAPESVYAPVNGSHAWMRDEIVGNLTQRLGSVPDDFVVIPTRDTESDIASGRPARYLVSVLKNGEWDLVRSPNGTPLSYAWDRTGPAQAAREQYQQQRKRVFAGPIDLHDINPALPPRMEPR